MRLYASKRIAPGLRVGMSVPLNTPKLRAPQRRAPARRPASAPQRQAPLPDLTGEDALEYYGVTAEEAQFAIAQANKQQLAEARWQQAQDREHAKKALNKARLDATQPKALRPVAFFMILTLIVGLFFPPLLIAAFALCVTVIVLAVRWYAAASRLPGGRNYKPGPQ